jgi:hypothetical protein
LGDVVHDLRSAMDNDAHYLAARHVQEAHSRDLTEEEEIAGPRMTPVELGIHLN